MTCVKCGSENVQVQAVTKIKLRHRGCLGWLLWILLAVCTIGIILIIPLITNTKIKSKIQSEAVCQNCGHRRKIK